jgi:hypothetical protein
MDTAAIRDEGIHDAARIATLPGEYHLSRAIRAHPGPGPAGISAAQTHQGDVALESTLLGLDRALTRAPLPMAPPPSRPEPVAQSELEPPAMRFRGSDRGAECAWDLCTNAYVHHDVSVAVTPDDLRLPASTRMLERRVTRTA